MIEHYDGELGVFDYDDSIWELIEDEDLINYIEIMPDLLRNEIKDEDFMGYWAVIGDCLRYVGDETDGSKIIIPKGIKSTYLMFKDSNIETMPELPYTVENATAMFWNCEKLKEFILTPKNKRCRDISYVCMNCTSLKTVDIYKSLVTCAEGAFANCISVVKMCKMPQTLLNADYMYENCIKMTQTPKLNEALISAEGMLAFCKSLKTAPKMHKGTKRIKNMFKGCESLMSVPKIPLAAREYIWGLKIPDENSPRE